MAITPFNTSPSNVNNAGFVPAKRKTFVVTGVVEPSAIGSGGVSILQTIIEMEREPSKYARKNVKTVKCVMRSRDRVTTSVRKVKRSGGERRRGRKGGGREKGNNNIK